jgi:hypothetical protein
MPTLQYPGFGGGLNLRDEADTVDPTQAFDLLNVTFTERGAVRQRAGYSIFNVSQPTASFNALAAYYKSDGTRQLVAGAGTELRVLDTTGAAIAAGTVTTSAGPHTFSRYGKPNAEYIFAANGTDALRRWDGSAWSNAGYTDATGTSLKGKIVCEYAKSNRLALARFPGTTVGNDPSTIRFSAAGDPLTWGANDYIDLTPGDGESIQAIVPWREYLFVFKETKFFVFYGESVASDGTVEFVYRPVNAGLGLVAPGAAVAAKDAVYFLTRTGVYKTVGSEPVRVSNFIDGVFKTRTPAFYSGSVINQSYIQNSVMWTHKERIYLSVPTSATTNDRTFVFDPSYNWWTVYDFPANAMTSFRVDTGDTDLMFAFSSGTNDIGRHIETLSQDNSVAISSHWSGGWWDHKQVGIQKVREYYLTGIGTVSVAMATDFKNASAFSTVDFAGADLWGDGSDPNDFWGDGTDPTDVWATGAVLDTQPVRRAVRGQSFSLQIRGLGGGWEVHRTAVRIQGTPSPYRIRG